MNDHRSKKNHVLTIEDLNFDPPCLPLEHLREVASACFGIEGEFRQLEGERDQNSRITTRDGRRFVLKVASAGEDQEVIDFQVQALLHIERNDATLPVPRMQRGQDGNVVYSTNSEKGSHAVRMLSWLPGILYQDGRFPSTGGLQQVGAFLGRLNHALAGFSHPAAGFFMPWDATNGLIFKPQLIGLLAPAVQELVHPVLQKLQNEVFPALECLPSQVIHQDGHGANLLRESADCEKVAGVIDFGDMVSGPLISDLAVTATHFLQHPELSDKQLADVAAALVHGFNAVNPLSSRQTDLLLNLVIARLILILQLFEFRHRNMDNPPAFVSEELPIYLATLERLLELDQAVFNRALKEACT